MGRWELGSATRLRFARTDIMTTLRTLAHPTATMDRIISSAESLLARAPGTTGDIRQRSGDEAMQDAATATDAVMTVAMPEVTSAERHVATWAAEFAVEQPFMALRFAVVVTSTAAVADSTAVVGSTVAADAGNEFRA